jgi:HAD superfamily hydrolase (TIGR01509 family)
MPAQNPKIKGVIFDLDGTLIDTLETYTRAFNQGIAGFNLAPISKETLATFLNRALPLEKILLELFPIPFEEKEVRLVCLGEIQKAYTALEKENVLLKPGVKEILPKLREMGLKIGIVTARMTSGEIKWRELRRLGINHFIDAMVTGAEAERKPATGSLMECIRQLGLFPAECVSVGDSRADIITGKAAGVITIALPTGVATREDLCQENPEAIIDNLTELTRYISELSSEAN